MICAFLISLYQEKNIEYQDATLHIKNRWYSYKKTTDKQ